MKQSSYVQTYRVSLNSNVWEDKYKEILFSAYNNENIEVISTSTFQVEGFLLITIIFKYKSEFVLPSGGWHDGDKNFD